VRQEKRIETFGSETFREGTTLKIKRRWEGNRMDLRKLW